MTSGGKRKGAGRPAGSVRSHCDTKISTKISKRSYEILRLHLCMGENICDVVDRAIKKLGTGE